MADPLLTAAVLAGAGVIIGSFLATLVVRWPQGRSVVRGRSACDACGRGIRASDMIPVASFIALRGRCRTCGTAIDRRHVAIEFAAGAVGASAGWAAPGAAGAAGAVFGWLLIALAGLDLAAWWLPDRLTGSLAIGGVAAGSIGMAPPLAERLIGGVAGLASLWLIAQGYRHWRGREGMGGGDPKLFGAIGLWLGWQPLPAVLMIACLIGLGVVGWRRLTGRTVGRHDAMPLGALLAVAAYPAWLAAVAWRP